MKVAQMVRTLAAAASLLAVCGTAAAQAGAYPVKPIRFLVGVAPGGGTDFVAPPLQASWPSDSARRSLRTIAPVRRARRARNGRQGAARRLHVRRLQHRPSDFGAAREVATHRSRGDFAPVSQIATGTLMLGLNAGVPTTTSKSRAAPGSLACMHHLVALISPITSAITLVAIASSSCAVRF